MERKRKADDAPSSLNQPAKRRKDEAALQNGQGHANQPQGPASTRIKVAKAKGRRKEKRDQEDDRYVQPSAQATERTQSGSAIANGRRSTKRTQAATPAVQQGQAAQPSSPSAQAVQQSGAVSDQSAHTQPTTTPGPKSLASVASAVQPSATGDASTGATRSHPTPQPILGANEPCPIDWTHPGLQRVQPAAREAYEMRSPWKAVSDYSIEEIRERLNTKYGVTISTEAWRKRSISANKAVFQATGQWWKGFPMGLEKFLPDLRDDKAGKAAKSSNVEEAAPAGKKSRKLHRAKGGIFSIVAEETDIHGPVQYVHHMTLQAAENASPLFKEAIDAGKDQYSCLFETDQRTLDIFLSCHAPEGCNNLPESIYRLEPGTGNSFHFVESPLDMKMADLFSLYVVGAELLSTKVCNIVMNAWRKIVIDETKLIQEFRTGIRPLSCTSPIPSVLDFEPESMNALFKNESVHDLFPEAIEFWLDVLADIKGPSAFDKIMEHRNEWHTEFLAQYGRLLPKDKAVELLSHPETIGVSTTNSQESTMANLHQRNYNGDADLVMADSSDEEAGARGDKDTYDEEDTNRKSAEDERNTLPSSLIDEGESLCETQTKLSMLEQLRGMKAEQGRIEGQGEPSEPPLAMRMLEQQVTLLKRKAHAHLLRQRLASEVEPQNTLGPSDGQMLAGHATNILHGEDDKFCDSFHVHDDKVNCTLPSSATNPVQLRPSARHRMRGAGPNVKVTIDGVHGYVIQNFTGKSSSRFQDYPRMFPEWDWPKVRAVHMFYQNPGDHADLYEKYKLLLPVPVYFDASLHYDENGVVRRASGNKKHHRWQDEFGRWPSHPGYQNPSWTPGTAMEDDIPTKATTPQLSEAWPHAGLEDEQEDEEDTDEESEEEEQGQDEGEANTGDEQDCPTAPSMRASGPLNPEFLTVPHPVSWWGLGFEDKGWLTMPPLDNVPRK